MCSPVSLGANYNTALPIHNKRHLWTVHITEAQSLLPCRQEQAKKQYLLSSHLEYDCKTWQAEAKALEEAYLCLLSFHVRCMDSVSQESCAERQEIISQLWFHLTASPLSQSMCHCCLRVEHKEPYSQRSISSWYSFHQQYNIMVYPVAWTKYLTASWLLKMHKYNQRAGCMLTSTYEDLRDSILKANTSLIRFLW